MRILRSALQAATLSAFVPLMQLAPLTAHAALGGAPGNIGTPAPVMLRATPPSTAALPGLAANAQQPSATPSYTMRQSTDANGVTIREYVLPGNTVFAVTWDGPLRPDMTKLLGSYFPSFAATAQRTVRGTGPLIDGNDDFRIESAGRLGHFFGIAYLPRQMPAGVQPGDLQ
jgi:hypothetical protein